VSGKVKFGAVEINGPRITNGTLLPMFVSGLSADHTRWAYQTASSKLRQWSMQLADLTTAQKKALEDFFTDTAKGPTNTFSYTHTDGSDYTARFASTELIWTRHDGNRWDVDITLETSAQID
jgi:hypothetical protein